MSKETIRILVVQNKAEDLDVIKRAFSLEQRIHFEMDCVHTLGDALGKLKSTDYGIVILDLVLPDSSGLETFDKIYQDAPQIPIIILSESDDEKIAFDAVQRGAQDYLVKGKVYDKVILRVMRYALERKRVEDRLRRSEELYRTLARNLPETAVMIFDQELRFKLSEGKALANQGLSREGLEGKTLWEALPQELSEKFEPYCRAALDDKKESFELNIRDSTYLFFTIPVKDDKEVIHSGLIMSIDITNRKALERVKDEFVNNVSHELRTPLAMIKEGISQVLEGTLGPLTDDQKQFLTITHDNTNRLTRIINELLDISKIEAGKVELRREYVDLVKIAKAVATTFKPELRKLGLELREVYAKPQVKIYADKDRITQVFVNLISNSLKFTEKGFIELGVIDKTSSVECYVKDTGKGIAESNLPNVFGKFRQFGREPGPGDRGTGLGLAISKGLVELHNGQIWVESMIAQGSTLTFSLPQYTAKKLFKNYIATLLHDARNGSNEPFSILLYNISNHDALAESIGKQQVASIMIQLEERIKKNLRRAADKTVTKGNCAILVILPETDRTKGLMAAGRFQHICEDFLNSLEIGKQVILDCNVASYPDDARTEEEFLRKVLW